MFAVASFQSLIAANAEGGRPGRYGHMWAGVVTRLPLRHCVGHYKIHEE